MYRSSIAPPTDASVYASRNTSRCRPQDSRPGWIRYFLSCRALASPTTCRFIPALSELPVTREEFPDRQNPSPKTETRLCGQMYRPRVGGSTSESLKEAISRRSEERRVGK